MDILVIHMAIPDMAIQSLHTVMTRTITAIQEMVTAMTGMVTTRTVTDMGRRVMVMATPETDIAGIVMDYTETGMDRMTMKTPMFTKLITILLSFVNVSVFQILVYYHYRFDT